MNSELKRDIVERLRNHALPDPHDEREVLHAPLLKEAAIEITRLRAALSTEAQPEVTGALGYVATKLGRFEFVGYDNKFLRDAYEDNGWTITAAYPPSAIEAAVREKLEEAAKVCDAEAKAWKSVTITMDDMPYPYEVDAECAKAIRALMESPHTSVEE